MNNLNCASCTDDDFNFDCGMNYYESITKSPKNIENALNLQAFNEQISVDMGKSLTKNNCSCLAGFSYEKLSQKTTESSLGKENCDNFVCFCDAQNDIIDKNKKGALCTQIVSENLGENLEGLSGLSAIDRMDDLIAKQIAKEGAENLDLSGVSSGSSQGDSQNNLNCPNFDPKTDLGDLSQGRTELTENNPCFFASGLDENNGESLTLQEATQNLKNECDKAVLALTKIGVVKTFDGEDGVDAVAFNQILAGDSENAKEIVLNAQKLYKCDLCNMTLSREDSDTWDSSSWVKFFLKAVKSVPFSLDYYDRLFNKHVQSSFYTSHIEKFGSTENFFEAMIEIIERKNVMKTLKAFIKRMYKELNDLEILIVDRFVFNADNLDEILEKVSYRTMYRKAEKIIPKLSEFLIARGYTPEWCKKTFGKII